MSRHEAVSKTTQARQTAGGRNSTAAAREQAGSVQRAAPRSPDDRTPQSVMAFAPGWQFSLRGMLLGMVLVSALFAVMRSFGPLGKTLIAWIAILIAGHVWATAVGTFLRRRHGHRGPLATADKAAPRASRTTEPRSVSLRSLGVSANAIHLRQQSRLARRTRTPITMGALLGGAAGTLLLVAVYGRGGLGAGIVLGGVSSAAIGGLLGFMASSCFYVARTAWIEATREAGSSAGSRANGTPSAENTSYGNDR